MRTNRQHFALKTYSNNQKAKKKERLIFNSTKEVEINGNGTSGYTVKHGENKGKVLGHITQKHSNNW
jgi:hypothetical protein